MIKWDLLHSCKNSSVFPINAIFHMNKIKHKNGMIIHEVQKKVYDKVQHPSIIKTEYRRKAPQHNKGHI